jgi:hypothetical protein
LRREMERLEARWRNMGDQLENAIQAMERIQARLGQG